MNGHIPSLAGRSDAAADKVGAPSRKIVHIDMDAFFASIEQRDNPELRGKPVVVGGKAESRGVVAAASYEARRFGIRSAMSSSEARRRCPQAIFLPPRISVYRRVSRVIFSVLREYTDLVEPLSLDEAYMDVTRNKAGLRFASQVASEARRKIEHFTGLTASAGVAPNKFLAKIASDMNKPNGMKVITPDDVPGVLRTLPIRAVPGVGRVTERKMTALGVRMLADLSAIPVSLLRSEFGKQAEWFQQIAVGVDERPVVAERKRKSVGAEDTFAKDTTDRTFLASMIQRHVQEIVARLEKQQIAGKTITLKVKYSNFQQVTRSRTVEHGVFTEEGILQVALELLKETDAHQRPVRLVGVSLSNLHSINETVTDGWRQLQLGFS